MAYTTTASVPLNSTGRLLLYTNPDTDPPFAAILPDSPYVLGSTFTIEEVWEVVTTITNLSLVDGFEEYPFTRYKLGNFTVCNSGGTPVTEHWGSGYINYSTHRIVKQSQWVVGIDTPNTPYQLFSDEIDNCSFATADVSVVVAGVSLQYQAPVTDDAVFKLRRGVQAHPLKNFAIKRVMPALGIYLFPGVALTSATYSMGAVNLAPVQLPDYTQHACTSYTKPSCDKQFADFMSANSNYYFTLAQCQANASEGGSTCQPRTYTCPTDPTKTYPFYSIGNVT